MGSSYFVNPVEFLVRVLFESYALIVMLRLLFQIVRADFYNPLSQFIFRMTTPILAPMRRVIPSIRGIDTACIVLLLVLKLAELGLLFGLHGVTLSFFSLLLGAVFGLLKLLFNIFFFAILLQVIISWINPGVYNPVLTILFSLTEPLLAPARKIIPPIGGFDLSPMVVIIILQLLEMLLIPL